MLDCRLYINGQWVDTVSGSVEQNINPADGSVVGSVQLAGPAEVEAAIAAAAAAAPAWAALPATQRQKYLLRAADHMEQNLDRFAGFLMDESGSVLSKSYYEIDRCAMILRSAAGECLHVEGGVCQPEADGQINTYIRQPLGVIVGLAPFNFPVLLALNKVAYALAVGNAFVLKPATDTPLAGAIIAECFDAAGLPAGVFNMVVGRGGAIGDMLIEDPRVKMVTFTGSTKVGMGIQEKCAKLLKRTTLEMGGKNPMIVLKDFDVDEAVKLCGFGAFFHQGQVCMCASRLIVEAPIYAEFCDKMAALAKAQKMGGTHDPEVTIGPLINDKQWQVIDRHIADAVAKGARLLCGGGHSGCYYEPSALADVTPEMEVFYEESFGPLTCIVKARDAEDALRLCNDNQYGLSASLLTNDIRLAMEMAPRIEAGMVHVNDATIMGAMRAPFGGVKGSGMGREDGQFSIDEYTELKWITYQTRPMAYPTDR